MCGAEQPQAVLDRSGHGLLVRHDVAAQSSSSMAQKTPRTVVGHRRRHLVGEEHGRRADEHALIDPTTKERARLEVTVFASSSPRSTCTMLNGSSRTPGARASLITSYGGVVTLRAPATATS